MDAIALAIRLLLLSPLFSGHLWASTSADRLTILYQSAQSCRLVELELLSFGVAPVCEAEELPKRAFALERLSNARIDEVISAIGKLPKVASVGRYLHHRLPSSSEALR